MFNKILIAVDQSAPAARAVDVAIDFATRLSARIGLVHVVDTALAFVPDLGHVDGSLLAELRRDGAAVLSAAAARIPPELLNERFLIEGDPAECILAKATEWSADLIVIGSDTRGRLAHFLLGSTADSVIRKAACPVISVRADISNPAQPLAYSNA